MQSRSTRFTSSTRGRCLRSRIRLRRRMEGERHSTIWSYILMCGSEEPSMKQHMTASILCIAFAALAFAQATTRPAQQSWNPFGDDKIRLVVRADDFGFSHASNMALEK